MVPYAASEIHVSISVVVMTSSRRVTKLLESVCLDVQLAGWEQVVSIVSYCNTTGWMGAGCQYSKLL